MRVDLTGKKIRSLGKVGTVEKVDGCNIHVHIDSVVGSGNGWDEIWRCTDPWILQ